MGEVGFDVEDIDAPSSLSKPLAAGSSCDFAPSGLRETASRWSGLSSSRGFCRGVDAGAVAVAEPEPVTADAVTATAGVTTGRDASDRISAIASKVVSNREPKDHDNSEGLP